MALENHRTGLFNSLALPALHEAYRNLIFEQLYTKFDMSPFQSICWATQEGGGQKFQSDIVVLPGEERFMVEKFGRHFSFTHKKAFGCQHKRVDTKYNKDDVSGDVTSRNIHYCSMDIRTRPLMCRAFPFGIARVPGNTRKLAIVADQRGYRVTRRRLGSSAINQVMHNVIQMAIAMWSFLDDKWWAYYEKAYCSKWKFEEIAQVAFSLTDDAIVSNIRGAPPVWRTQVLAQMADPDCLECSGHGWSFMDRSVTGAMLPVNKRRFDVCMTCIMPAIGVRFKDMLVDPSSGKVLDASGKEYRGDRLDLEDRRK